MNIILKVKKIGNHWYPNIAHDSPDEIMLDEKVEKVLSKLDVDNEGELSFLLYEVHTWIEKDTLQFNDEDMWRWLNTTDSFDLRMYIRDYEYKVSSALIDLFEDQFNMDFYDTLYTIELCNM
jgi:hypothetical protein